MMEFILPLPELDDQTSASHKSWKQMKQRFKDYFLVKHEDKMFSDCDAALPTTSLLMYISGNKIKDILKALSSDIDNKFSKIDDVFENIEDLCLPNFILLYERFKFFSFRQKQFEDFSKFVSELQMLGGYCELQEHESKYVINRIVNAVHSEALKKHLQSIPDLELENAIQICIEAENGISESCGDVMQEKKIKCFRHVEDKPLILNEKKEDHKTTLIDKMLPRRTRAEKSRLKRNKAGNINTCSSTEKGNNSICVDNLTASPVHGPFLRQTRSRSVSNSNIQSQKPLTSKRFMKSQSDNSASEGNDLPLAAKQHTYSVGKICDKSDESPSFSDHSVMLKSRETPGQENVSLIYISEDYVMNDACLGKEANEIESSMMKEVDNKDDDKDDQLDYTTEKDVKDEANILSEEIQNFDKNCPKLNIKKFRKCPICGLKFATAYLLKCHSRIHSGQRLYKCSVCDLGFIHCGSRSRHMRQAHPEVLQFQCNECDMLFERQKALDQHKLSHSKEQEITCSDCGLTFMSTREHYQHQRREHKNTRYNCSKCDLYFPYPSKLKLHLMSKHNATKPFMCEICGSSFAEKNMLTTHKNIHSGEKKHECPTCGRRFLLKTTLTNHIQTHLDRKPHTCDVCGMSFKLSYYLKSHMKIHSQTRERPHMCSKCGAAFLKLAQLRNHERKHTGEKPFKCEVCHSLFSQLSSMKKHIKQIHEGLKPKDRFSCEYCGLSFTHSCKLKLHLMKHTGERPFACKVCGSTYRENHQLKSHMKIHSGSEPFKCPICGRRFLQKSSLEGHIRKHTGEKPFRCTICFQHFSHKGYLRDHMKVHDQNRVRKYKCSICDKAFTCSSHMRSHERLHSGEKPHKCDICGSRFTKRSSVKKHLRRTHGVQDTTVLQNQDSFTVQNIQDTAVTHLKPVHASSQDIHSEQQTEIHQHRSHLPQTLLEVQTDAQTDLPVELRPVLHAVIDPHLQSHSTHICSNVGSKVDSGLQLQPPHNMYVRLHSEHASHHHQIHQHPGIHILQPNVHPSLHVALHTQLETQMTTAVNANLGAQQPDIVQEMHIYTLAR